MYRVLVVDDDQGLRNSISSVLKSTEKYEVHEAFDGLNAVEKIKADENFDIVILDVDMPRLNGLDALKIIKDLQPGMIVIMMTAYATIDSAIQAVKDGAFHYLSKPVQSEELISLMEKALQAHILISSVASSSPVLMEGGRKFIGNASQMQKVFHFILKLSKVDTPVLIRGASGTGKELVARAIHFNSIRKDEKFVAINCSAIPDNLFESELFGHEKGSFTGADQRKIGKFQYAEGGTLFLDEVGDLPAHMQVKLLRVLQEKVFSPVGSNREIPTNVRIVAATNRPLEEMMKSGSFREDLFYRLNVIPIFLPPLADRIDDLDSLVHIFIRKLNESHHKKILGISNEAMGALKKYSWPGNIRELENVIEHAFVLENENQISLISLPEHILAAAGINLPEYDQMFFSQANKSSSLMNQTESVPSSEEDDTNIDNDDVATLSVANSPAAGKVDEHLDFNLQKEMFEKEFITKALKMFKGRINQTSLHTNIPKKTLLRKIEKFGINPGDFDIK